MTGTYTEIVELDAPSGARAGEQVSVVAKVSNLADYAIYIAVTAVFDNTEFPLSPEYVAVEAGQTYTFAGAFTMPSHGVTVTAYSYYWTGSDWHKDDQASVDIALAELVSEFSQFQILDYAKR